VRHKGVQAAAAAASLRLALASAFALAPRPGRAPHARVRAIGRADRVELLASHDSLMTDSPLPPAPHHSHSSIHYHSLLTTRQVSPLPTFCHCYSLLFPPELPALEQIDHRAIGAHVGAIQGSVALGVHDVGVHAALQQRLLEASGARP